METNSSIKMESDSESLKKMAQYIWAHQSFLEIKDSIPGHEVPYLDFDPQTIQLKKMTDMEYLTRYLPKMRTAQEAEVVGKLCPICYDLFDSREMLVRKLSCGHVYHKECLDPWISEHKDELACPYCRKSQYE